jgi:phosphate transport system permease protein
MSATIPRSGLTRKSLLPDEAQRLALRRRRRFRDHGSRYGVGTAGIGVILALGLIFAYLFYETIPLLKPASVVQGPALVLDERDEGSTLHLLLDRFEQIAARFSDTGSIVTFDAQSGSVRERLVLPVPAGETISSFGRAEPRRGLFVAGFSDGSVLPFQLEFVQSFVDNARQTRARLAYPWESGRSA